MMRLWFQFFPMIQQVLWHSSELKQLLPSYLVLSFAEMDFLGHSDGEGISLCSQRCEYNPGSSHVLKAVPSQYSCNWERGNSKLPRCNASHMPPLCAVGYRNQCDLTILACWDVTLGEPLTSLHFNTFRAQTASIQAPH